MPETLRALYYGNIAPFEAPIPVGSPLRKLAARLERLEAALRNLPDEEDKTLIKEFINLHEQTTAITSEENFIRGFQLGVQIAVECLTERQGGEVDG